MGVCPITEIASPLRCHLKHDTTEVDESERPDSRLDRIAGQPERGAADGITPGIEVVKCFHGASIKRPRPPAQENGLLLMSEKTQGLGKPYGHRTDGEIRGE